MNIRVSSKANGRRKEIGRHSVEIPNIMEEQAIHRIFPDLKYIMYEPIPAQSRKVKSVSVNIKLECTIEGRSNATKHPATIADRSEFPDSLNV